MRYRIGNDRKKLYTPDPKKILGAGGEGTVYDLGNGHALKLLHGEDSPLYAGSTSQMQRERENAKRRLEVMQEKLQNYPKLPDTVISPVDLVFDENDKFAGFTMRRLDGGDLLRQYSKSGFRKDASISNADVCSTFINLHQTVTGIHKEAVIGDFNYLGAYVLGGKVYLIDADSMQFGKWQCTAFTPRFVDPLLCKPDELLHYKPHNTNSDWYAFFVMLFEALTYVHPYGGVYTKQSTMKMDERILKRLWVGGSDVTYPGKSLPLNCLSDEFLDILHKTVLQDWRGEFPERILANMKWQTCPACGAEHARRVCPVCNSLQAIPVIPFKEERFGKITIITEFTTSGVILHASMSGDNLLLVYHEGKELKREGNMTVGNLDLKRGLRVLSSGNKTVIGQNGTMMTVEQGQVIEKVQVDTYRNSVPCFAANSNRRFWVDGDRLLKSTSNGLKNATPQFVGSVIQGQTLFWVGQNFGFGFYRAGQYTRSFVFGTEDNSFNDSIKLPKLLGDPLDAVCYFSSRACWFCYSANVNGRVINHCIVLDSLGKFLAEAKAEEDDGTWLGSIRSKCALSLKDDVHGLFSHSATGLVRVEERAGQIEVTRSYPDTANAVSEGDRIFVSGAKGGIYVVASQKLMLLKLQ